jgi:hypothetical protein
VALFLFKVGSRVQEVAAPHRKGTVRAIRGRGASAVIAVGLDGYTIAYFRPSALTII